MAAGRRRHGRSLVGNAGPGRVRASGSASDRAELAGYIATLAAELVTLARAADLRTLAYLTDMVRLEAEHQGAVLRAGEGSRSAADQASDTRPAAS